MIEMLLLLLVICLTRLPATLSREDDNYGLSFDPSNFLCRHYEEFCATVLDGLGCVSQSMIGCPNYPAVSNDIANFVGTCSCSDTGLSVAMGSDVTYQIMRNRIEDDMYWLMEPWNSGPPFSYGESYSAVCTLLLDRIGCQADDQTIDSSNFSCACGTLSTESSEFVQTAVTKRLSTFNVETEFPVFARPVYLSLPVSMAIILITGKVFAVIAVFLHIPAIVGFICAGIMLQNYIDPDFLSVGSTELKKLALLIVLMRAGLSIKVKEVRRTQLASALLSTVPYFCEFLSWLFLASSSGIGDLFSGWSIIEMGVLASVMTPLGPSVVITQALTELSQKGRKIGFVPKMSLITAPLEAVLAIFMYDTFTKSLEEEDDFRRYPWVQVQPLWATVVLIPVNIIFSVVLGLLVGYVCARYIDWRSRLRADFLWVRLNKNLQMGSNTADLVFVLLVSCYTMMSLCVPRYIQHSTGILVVFTICLTIKFFVRDITIVANIAEGLRAIWIFGEVFLCTLLGATIAFNHSNGPLASQRGLSGEDLGNVAIFMLIGTLCRFGGVCLSILLVMYPHLPKHRQQFSFLWRYCLSTWLLQLPRSTIQASLGPLVFSEHLFPGDDGQSKAFVVSQSGAFTVIVFAPLGALLSKHIAFKLTRQMTIMDEENNYNHSKFRYYSAETVKKRILTPSHPKGGQEGGKDATTEGSEKPGGGSGSGDGKGGEAQGATPVPMSTGLVKMAETEVKRARSRSSSDNSVTPAAATLRGRNRTVSKNIHFSSHKMEGSTDGESKAVGLAEEEVKLMMVSPEESSPDSLAGVAGPFSPHISHDAARSPAVAIGIGNDEDEYDSCDEERPGAFDEAVIGPQRVNSPDDWEKWEAAERSRGPRVQFGATERREWGYEESEVSSWEDENFNGSDTEAASDDEDLDGEEDETVNQQEIIRQSQLQDMPSLFDAMLALRRGAEGIGFNFDRSRSSSRAERDASPGPMRHSAAAASTTTTAVRTEYADTERSLRRPRNLELRSFSHDSQDQDKGDSGRESPGGTTRRARLEGGVNVARVRSFSDTRGNRPRSPHRYAGGPGSDASGSDAGGASPWIR